jgi:hypothetical protein
MLIPPLFWCHYTGAGGSLHRGPYRANAKAADAGHVLLTLSCPPLELHALKQVGGYSNDEAPIALNISATHYAPTGQDALVFEWHGASTAPTVMFNGLIEPPPPPPPPPPGAPNALSCAEWYARLTPNERKSGEYELNIGGESVSVYCDMSHQGGGWTRVARGVGSKNSGWTTTSALNVDSNYAPSDASKSYKLSDAMINAIPKRSYRVHGVRDDPSVCRSAHCPAHRQAAPTLCCSMRRSNSRLRVRLVLECVGLHLCTHNWLEWRLPETYR